MKKDDSSTTDKILDLLLDALMERQQARQAEDEAADSLQQRRARIKPPPPTASRVSPPPQPEPQVEPEIQVEPQPRRQVEPVPLAEPSPTIERRQAEATGAAAEAETAVSTSEPEATEPTSIPSVQLDRMLTRLALGLALLILIVNIPYNRFGTSLARAMPDVQSLIIRDGLVIKGSGERIYVLENNQKRWITTLDAFEWHGYRWEQVNEVEDSFLNRFEDGRPIYVLLKCEQSPHIYALEDGQKRWIRDIPTFEAEGFVWEDVRFVSCDQLRNMPNGLPFPPDAGPVPAP